jgi:hypothetical protein
MKQVTLVIIMIMAITGCRETSESEELPAVNDEQLEEVAGSMDNAPAGYLAYGDLISEKNPMQAQELATVYDDLQPQDTVQVKVKTTINEVCAKKGCWISIPVGNDQTARVTFKDYQFFLPRNAQSQEVILKGIAFKETTSAEDLRHYAMDAGKSAEEVQAIQNDETTLSFVATGALVSKFDNPDVYDPNPTNTVQ